MVTIEGVAQGRALHPVQAAFISHDSFQCGFCTPGQIMSAIGMIREGQAGNDPERVREASAAISVAAARTAASLKRCWRRNGAWLGPGGGGCMNRFDYIRPATVSEAVAAAAVPGSAYLAAGTNLIDLMKGGIVSPKRLVNISRLPGLELDRTAAGWRNTARHSLDTTTGFA